METASSSTIFIRNLKRRRIEWMGEIEQQLQKHKLKGDLKQWRTRNAQGVRVAKFIREGVVKTDANQYEVGNAAGIVEKRGAEFQFLSTE